WDSAPSRAGLVKRTTPAQTSRHYYGLSTFVTKSTAIRHDATQATLELCPRRIENRNLAWHLTCSCRSERNCAVSVMPAENRRTGEMSDQMGDLVRALRQELKMTQEEFAHELGITVGTVNRWENGRFRPSKLARASILDFAARHGLSVEAM